MIMIMALTSIFVINVCWNKSLNTQVGKQYDVWFADHDSLVNFPIFYEYNEIFW